MGADTILWRASGLMGSALEHVSRTLLVAHLIFSPVEFSLGYANSYAMTGWAMGAAIGTAFLGGGAGGAGAASGTGAASGAASSSAIAGNAAAAASIAAESTSIARRPRTASASSADADDDPSSRLDDDARATTAAHLPAVGRDAADFELATRDLIIVAEHTAEADMAETDAIVCGVPDRSCYPDGQGLGRVKRDTGEPSQPLCDHETGFACDFE